MASVLLVEDQDSIRNIYSFALEKEGFKVVAVPGAGEALVAAEGQKFDVILLDMLLADGMSGLDFLRNYDVRVKSPGTQVVALSNIDSTGVVEKAQDLGVVGYLNKADTEPSVLVSYLRELLASPVQPGGAVVQAMESPVTLQAAETPPSDD